MRPKATQLLLLSLMVADAMLGPSSDRTARFQVDRS